VPSPPVGVAHETVSLDLDATGHATKEIPIRLRGAIARYEPFAHYTILIMPPKAASKLERLRSHARVIPDKSGGIPEYNRSGTKFQAMYWAIKSEQAPEEVEGDKGDEELFAPGKIARLEVHTAPRSSAITITAPDTAQRDRTFTVAVTVKNPGKRALTGLEVSLNTLDGMLDDQVQGRYAGIAGSEITIEAGDTKLDLAGHETKRVEFHVTANADGVVGLYARASCGEDCRDLAPLLAGAVEATEIVERPTLVGDR
jgi:hypothetical protein